MSLCRAIGSLIVVLITLCFASPGTGQDVVRFRAATTSAGGRAYVYWKFSRASRTVQPGDFVEYDVYVNNNVGGVGGIEVYNTDGSSWRDLPGWEDENGGAGHPAWNIASYAYRKWYHRKLTVPPAIIGKTISFWDVAVDGTYGADQTLSAQYDNVVITHGGSVVLTAYQSGTPQLNMKHFDNGGVAVSNLISGPTRSPGRQVGALLFTWHDAPDNNAEGQYMVYPPHGLAGDPYSGYGGGYYSSLNEDWWEGELQDMKRAGVDFAGVQEFPEWPETFGGRVPIQKMVLALERSGCDIKIACWGGNGANCVWNQDNGRGYNQDTAMPLSDHNTWKYFYDRDLKTFFETIPQKYWATHNGLSLEDGGRPLIIPYDTYGYLDVATDAGWLWQWVKVRFAADFKDANGNGIVPFVVLENSWFDQGGGGSADGRYAFAAAAWGPNTFAVNGYYTTEIGPGCDDRVVRSPGTYTPRQDGGQMVRWFNSLVSGRQVWDSNLCLLETWNELWEGTGIARLMHYPASSGGFLPETHYIDLWRNLMASSIGFRDYDATFLRTWEIPEFVLQGSTISVTVRNDGLLPWQPGDCALGGRLLDPATHNTIPGTEGVLASLPQTVYSGDECALNFPVPVGWPSQSILQLDMKHGSTWLASEGDFPVNKALWKGESLPLGQAKARGPGWVGLTKGFVTAIFKDSNNMVIEAEDRSSAITVTPIGPVNVQIGDELESPGVIQSDGRLQIIGRARRTGRNEVMKPLGVSNRGIVSTQDLLVSTWGKVIDTPWMFSDGSLRFHVTDGFAWVRKPEDIVRYYGGPSVDLADASPRLFADGFDSGRKPSWFDYSEPTSVQDGKLVADGTSNNVICIRDFSPTDAKVSVDATAGLQMGILLRYRDGGNLVLCFYAPVFGGNLAIHEVVNGEWGPWLNPMGAPGLTGTVHMLAEVHGSLVSVSLTDGTKTYSTGYVLQTQLGPGLVGLYHDTFSSQSPVYFDNYQVFQTPPLPWMSVNRDAVEVIVPSSLAGAGVVYAHDYISVTGIAGKSVTASGTIRAVTIRKPEDIVRY